MNVREMFGDIDIYLFDQLLKGRIGPGMRILDAGCGQGRNLVYFMREGYDIYGVDRSEEAIAAVRELALALEADTALPGGLAGSGEERFRVEPIEKLSFANDYFDVVICNAVLHFAADEAHFLQMAGELWRVLKHDGFLFVRMASKVGMERRVRPIPGTQRHLLPDGTELFLADDELLGRMAEKLHGQWLEPVKTVLVGDRRAMTTCCLKKPRILFFEPIAADLPKLEY